MFKEITPLEVAANRYLSDFEVFAANDCYRDPEWLREIRNHAMGDFGLVGFPTTHDERWRFTNIQRIADSPFAMAKPEHPQVSLADVENRAPNIESGWRVVFFNGRFSSELSSISTPSRGILVGNLEAALAEAPSQVEQHFARLALPSENAFAMLSMAFSTDCAVLFVPDGVTLEVPIHLLYLSDDFSAGRVAHSHNLVVLGRNSSAMVVESHVGLGKKTYWSNPVSEFVVGENGRLRVYRTQLESHGAFHTATTQVRQARDSVFEFTTVELGAELSRHDINVTLDGIGGECYLNGLMQLGDRQHVDSHTTIEHAQPGCVSREHVNGIFDGRSRGVFTGRVVVQPKANQTDAKQSSRNLLLSETSRADAQPQLEIYADDVKCTHGATIGPIDEEAMYYLQSRGLSAAAARDMLTYAFGSEILDTIQLVELRRALQTHVQNGLLLGRTA